MAAKNKKKPQQKQQFDQTQISVDEQNVDKLISQKFSTVEISASQAQLYFQYLRKKITHQKGDPFSLLFLNLKFQQLQSWKGATEQLNLQSRIYGMRVDNCHDSTIKMLNFTIRNQQQQIGRNIGVQVQKNQVQQRKMNQNKKQVNFNLEKPERLSAGIQIDKNLHNRYLWKTIFKKSERLAEIQLNTIQLSANLSLEIDRTKLSYTTFNHQFQGQVSGNHQNINSFFQIQETLGIQQRLLIFKEIHLIRQQINEEVQQIALRINIKNQKSHQNQLQQIRFGDLFGAHDFQLMEFYDQFNGYQRHKPINQLQETQFEQEKRQNVFNYNINQLHSIPIQYNTEHQRTRAVQYESLSEDSEHDLYQPQKDILFDSTTKKRNKSKRTSNHIFRKRNKSYKKVQFNQDFYLNRKQVFFKRSSQKNNIKNDNLIPINFVVVYENRNPFRKIKKGLRNADKNNRPSYQQSNYDKFFNDNTNILQSFQSYTQPMNEQSRETKSKVYEDPQAMQSSNKKTYKNVSIKMVKSQIKNQITHEGNTTVSKPLGHLQCQNQTNHQKRVEQEPENRIGLRYLRQKMNNYDPLDILVSMLHIAYEQQVKLEPIYQVPQDYIKDPFSKLNDIIITTSQNTFY